MCQTRVQENSIKSFFFNGKAPKPDDIIGEMFKYWYDAFVSLSNSTYYLMKASIRNSRLYYSGNLQTWEITQARITTNHGKSLNDVRQSCSGCLQDYFIFK